MILKNGFLLVELMIGLTLLIFLISIITHYIIEVKNVQQHTIIRMEALSCARNIAEKMIAYKADYTISSLHDNNFMVQIDKKKIFPLYKNTGKGRNNFFMNNIAVSWGLHNKKQSLILSSYVAKD